MVAVVDGTLAQLQVAPSITNVSLLAARASYSIEPTNLSNGCQVGAINYQSCLRFNEMLNASKEGDAGEMYQKFQQGVLTDTGGILADLSKWFAATTGTLGAAVAISGASMPLAAVAAITQVTVTGNVALFGINAARLSANSTDKEAAKDLRDDFTGTLEYMRDSVLSPAITGYISNKAGIIYDLFTAWKPIVEEKIPVFITQVKNFIDEVVPPTCTFFTYSAWSVCQPDNTQTRTVISSSPAGCTGGNPILSQSCVQACNSQQVAGGDTADTRTIELSRTSGTFSFSYDTYSVKDKIIVQYQGQTLFDTGCVGASGTQSITYFGSSTQVTVSVTPNCVGGTSGTAWTYTVACPQ